MQIFQLCPGQRWVREKCKYFSSVTDSAESGENANIFLWMHKINWPLTKNHYLINFKNQTNYCSAKLSTIQLSFFIWKICDPKIIDLQKHFRDPFCSWIKALMHACTLNNASKLLLQCHCRPWRYNNTGHTHNVRPPKYIYHFTNLNKKKWLLEAGKIFTWRMPEPGSKPTGWRDNHAHSSTTWEFIVN